MVDAPIFIGGLSYSGKTQLRQMLEAHPGLSLVRRTKLWRHHGAFGDLRQEENRATARSVLASSQSKGPLRPNWDKVFEEFDTGEFTYARLFGIIHRQHAESAGYARWGEQYGGIVGFAEDIFSTFPEAKMIHMIRHTGARLSRMAREERRRGWVGWETAASVESARLARAQSEAYPNGYMVLSYEELSRDPLGALEAVCAFIDEASEPILDAGVINGVRFDDQQELLSDAPRVIRDFSESAEAHRERAETVDRTEAPRLGVATVARFPVDSLAMLCRTYAQKWGRPE